MADHTTETRNAKLIITITCVIAHVVLALGKLINPQFQVDIIVYAIIGGVLFGVNGIRELLTFLASIKITVPKIEVEETTDEKKGKKDGRDN